MSQSLERLDAAVDEPLPAPVRQATTATDLHDALLDWQDELLDRVVPWRARERLPA